MLRALARGRALALRLPGASTAAYAEALERQIRDFPRDPSTDEARWLLGELACASAGPRPGRRPLVGDPPRSARWLDSRLAIAALDRDELDRLLINPDRATSSPSGSQRADRFLTESLRQARSEEADGRAAPGPRPAQPDAHRGPTRTSPGTSASGSPGSRLPRASTIAPGSSAWSPWSSSAATSRPNARPRPTSTGTSPPNDAVLVRRGPAPRPVRRDRRDRPAAAAIRAGPQAAWSSRS